MKITVTRSRWPWGRPNVRVDMSVDEGMVSIRGALERDIVWDGIEMAVAIAFEKAVQGELDRTQSLSVYNRDSKV